MIESNERTFAMLCHLSALIGFFIPFGHIIGPLIIWLIKKDTSKLVDDQGRESLNFQISLTIYIFILTILAFLAFAVFFLIFFQGLSSSNFPLSLNFPFGSFNSQTQYAFSPTKSSSS